MSQTERVLRIQQMLQARKAIPRKEFLAELEISLATFKRDLEFLRSRFQVNVEWSRERGGYCCEDLRSGDGQGKIPGPMYAANEIHALLLIQDLLIQLQPGLLEMDLSPLRLRLESLLGTNHFEPDQIRRRIRILHMTSRPVDSKCFQSVSTATLSRRRLKLKYCSRFRGGGEETVREVSPQRLVYYRANWYLDSWCHLRNGLRSFALDMIRDAEMSDIPADDISDEVLDAHLGSSYGIFGGAAPEHSRLAIRTARHSMGIAGDLAPEANPAGGADGPPRPFRALLRSLRTRNGHSPIRLERRGSFTRSTPPRRVRSTTSRR